MGVYNRYTALGETKIHAYKTETFKSQQPTFACHPERSEGSNSGYNEVLHVRILPYLMTLLIIIPLINFQALR